MELVYVYLRNYAYKDAAHAHTLSQYRCRENEKFETKQELGVVSFPLQSRTLGIVVEWLQLNWLTHDICNAYIFFQLKKVLRGSAQQCSVLQLLFLHSNVCFIIQFLRSFYRENMFERSMLMKWTVVGCACMQYLLK